MSSRYIHARPDGCCPARRIDGAVNRASPTKRPASPRRAASPYNAESTRGACSSSMPRAKPRDCSCNARRDRAFHRIRTYSSRFVPISSGRSSVAPGSSGWRGSRSSMTGAKPPEIPVVPQLAALSFSVSQANPCGLAVSRSVPVPSGRGRLPSSLPRRICSAVSARRPAVCGVCTIAAAGDWAMNPATRSATRGVALSAVTIAPPDDSPITVMRDGSPPKLSALACTHSMAVMMSESPVLLSKRSASRSSALPRASWPRMPTR